MVAVAVCCRCHLLMYKHVVVVFIVKHFIRHIDQLTHTHTHTFTKYHAMATGIKISNKKNQALKTLKRHMLILLRWHKIPYLWPIRKTKNRNASRVTLGYCFGWCALSIEINSFSRHRNLFFTVNGMLKMILHTHWPRCNSVIVFFCWNKDYFKFNCIAKILIFWVSILC